MFKSLFLTLVLIFSCLIISAGDPPKEVNLTSNWTQVIHYSDNNYNVQTQNITPTTYPSFIVTKSVEYTKKGTLVKVWVASYTLQNGFYKNIILSNVSIEFYNGNYWQENFNIRFIVVGQNSTQVHYFFTDNPNVQVKFKWRTAKINN